MDTLGQTARKRALKVRVDYRPRPMELPRADIVPPIPAPGKGYARFQWGDGGYKWENER